MAPESKRLESGGHEVFQYTAKAEKVKDKKRDEQGGGGVSCEEEGRETEGQG